MATRSRNATEADYQSYFDSHIKHDPVTDCYLWTAAKNNIGFGFFRYQGKMQTAHRVALKLIGQDIEGKVVHHVCNNYDCVNPDHLVAGTYKNKGESMSKKGSAGVVSKNPKYFQTCPHCGYHGIPGILGRFHNDKCSQKV